MQNEAEMQQMCARGASSKLQQDERLAARKEAFFNRNSSWETKIEHKQRERKIGREKVREKERERKVKLANK